MGILPQNRLGSQRLDPPRLPVGPGFRLDLVDQLRDPPPVLLRRQVRPAGKLRTLGGTCSGHSEALELLPEVQDLFRQTALPLDRVRLRWTEGSIAFGLGRLDEVEAAYREVQQEFLKHGVLYSVALVSLDLALLLSRQGRTGELEQLAAELMAVFSAQEIHREATAALVLFQRACEEDRVTAELIARLATLLRRTG